MSGLKVLFIFGSHPRGFLPPRDFSGRELNGKNVMFSPTAASPSRNTEPQLHHKPQRTQLSLELLFPEDPTLEEEKEEEEEEEDEEEQEQAWSTREDEVQEQRRRMEERVLDGDIR
ncbi:unnamed protein product [Pleuronectes platessa]|uniref:Uncharacterized protein n=1 Tax=Pleuronectes platessa TaxID=8262 RepID=A0A9N7U5R4_PLEPL|nr:unnamed protein product [Pleuronectes platessa]